MMKLALDTEAMLVDLAKNSALANDGDLTTAVIISLFTDRRADLDDELTEYAPASSPLPPDRRGWAGDALPAVTGDRIGSRLWLLTRAKQTEETRKRAIEYAREALQWLIDDGHALNIDVTAEWTAFERLQLTVVLATPEGVINIPVPTNIGGAYVV